ncbi:hypothetical protein M9Y10_002493 [Tritrichomonas musculus]|uniref:RGS domain-containing protein n=1 Tax=Tritrichomonas musculus TaxID=1915356 RepID=A0ABR2LCG0_9EUKA
MDDKKEFLLSLTNFDSTFVRYEELKKNRFLPAIRDVHNFLMQISVYQYLLFYSEHNYSSDELIRMLNKIRQPSAPKLYNTFRWAVNKINQLITCNRQLFATALTKFAKSSVENSQSDLFNYFSIITFPSIFCHFADQEFERLGYIFIKMIMKTLPSIQYQQLIYSFLLESGEFQTCLWDLFDEYAAQTVTQNSSSQYFLPLLSALTKAVPLLTYYQVKLLSKFQSDDPQSFTSFFITKFLLNSYNIYHSSRIVLQNQANPIEDLADFFDSIGKSPHTDLLFATLHNAQKFRQLPRHAMFTGIGDYPLFLSIKDIYIIQLIMKTMPDEKELKFPDAFIISEDMKDQSISAQITSLLFINKNDYQYLYSDDKQIKDKKKDKFELLKSKEFKQMVDIPEIPAEPKNTRIDELNERMKLVANQNGFSGTLAFLKSNRQGPLEARRMKEKLSKDFDSNTKKYIEGLYLNKNAVKLANIDNLFVTDLYYFHEIQKLLNKITRHLMHVLYYLLSSLYQSDRPSVDPLLTTSLELRALQSSTVVQAEVQSWSVLRHKDCFNYVEITDASDFLRSNLFQTLNGKINRPINVNSKKKSSFEERRYKSDVPNIPDFLSGLSSVSKNNPHNLAKKRRNSFDATKSVSSTFQFELIKKLGLVNKTDKFLMFIIFVRMFDQSNLEDSQVPQLRKLYIRLMDSLRIKKLAKPNSLTFKQEKKMNKKSKKDKKKDLRAKFDEFEECFAVITRMIDDLAKIRKASCILKLAEISCKIQEVTSNYLSYISSPKSADCGCGCACYSPAYLLSSFTASARQCAIKNNEDDNSGNKLFQKVAYMIFKHCLLMSTTDAFYVAFVWEQKLMTIFPILKQHTNIPNLNLPALECLESCFYDFLKKDPILFEKTQEIRRFLFK